MKAAIYSLLILGAFPLLIYPMVFLAGMMSLAGHDDGLLTCPQFMYQSL